MYRMVEKMKKQNEGDCATPNVYSFHLLTRGIYSSFNKLLNNVKIKSMPAVAAMEIHCSDVPLREAAVGVWQNDKPSCHIFRAYEPTALTLSHTLPGCWQPLTEHCWGTRVPVLVHPAWHRIPLLGNFCIELPPQPGKTFSELCHVLRLF